MTDKKLIEQILLLMKSSSNAREVFNTIQKLSSSFRGRTSLIHLSQLWEHKMLRDQTFLQRVRDELSSRRFGNCSAVARYSKEERAIRRVTRAQILHEIKTEFELSNFLVNHSKEIQAEFAKRYKSESNYQSARIAAVEEIAKKYNVTFSRALLRKTIRK